uniref:Expansin-like EG45 domain-containing protein n=1 Tax=Kalanchoe fedtschenkoi TaxID=63787 RepID=A0A7N0V8E1_KALFE
MASSVLYVSFFCFLVASVGACDRCLHQSKAAFFSSPAALNTGACGYGSLAIGFNGGHQAADAPSIFMDGAGCGACFQIRCKDPKVCSKTGTKIIVTDLNKSNKTDFVLSSRAFRAMANKGMDRELIRMGIADVEYRRQNLAVRVEDQARRHTYLAVKFLYQGGQTEIVGVDVYQGRTRTQVLVNF